MVKKLEDSKSEMIVCNLAGYCTVECPSRTVMHFSSYSARGRLVLCELLLRGRVEPTTELRDRLQTCTTCRRCDETCPSDVEQYEMIERARAYLIEKGVPPPEQFIPAFENIMKKDNVLGIDQSKRVELVKEINPTSDQSDTLLWMGCMFSYRYPEIAKTVGAILNAAGYDYMMLSDKETCCGDPLKMIGMYPEFEEIAKRNLDLFNELEIKRIVSPCPMCTKALGHSYEESFGETSIEVLHIAQVYDQLIKEGKLKYTAKVPLSLTYFDPCHLGRHLKVYDPPRAVLKAVPGLQYADIPEYNRENNWCCGGAVRIGYVNTAVSVSEEAIAKIEKGGFEAVVTACPQCYPSLQFATFDTKVYDINEIVAAAMGIKELGSGFVE